MGKNSQRVNYVDYAPPRATWMSAPFEWSCLTARVPVTQISLLDGNSSMVDWFEYNRLCSDIAQSGQHVMNDFACKIC